MVGGWGCVGSLRVMGVLLGVRLVGCFLGVRVKLMGRGRVVMMVVELEGVG